MAQSAPWSGCRHRTYDPTVNPELPVNAATSFWALCPRRQDYRYEYSDAIASDIKLNVHTKSQGCSLAGDKAFLLLLRGQLPLQDESSCNC